MAPIRAVVFDLGHTIWDFAPAEHNRRLGILRLHARLARELGDVPAPRELDHALNATAQRWVKTWDEEREQLLQPPSEELVRDVLHSAVVSVSDALLLELTEIFFGTERDMPVVEPDTLAALAELHGRGLRMGCVTNTMLLEGAIADVLYRLGLHRYFTTAVVSSATGHRKPHASLFERALAGLGVAPQETVFVGDRLADDIAGAQAAGMRAVLTHQYRQEQPDGAPVPDAIMRRLAQLPRVVDELDGRS